MAGLEELKKVACDTIDNASRDLHDLSKVIWEKPELSFNEHSAHEVLCTFLEKQGFLVEPKFHLETAFRATYGSEEGPHIVVICEYDALPSIGHACGHNLIAEAGAGAGLGIKTALEAAEKAGKKLGKVIVLGTPAEEGGGGKIELIKAGVLDGVNIAMMSHPWCTADQVPIPNFLAGIKVNVKYLGKASHAAGAPWAGLNALDAAVMAYNNVSCMRQQMKPSCRVHGIITNGGTKPNIIPEEAEVAYLVRAPNMGELEVLKKKITSCFEAAATATGCKFELEWNSYTYENVITNNTLASLFEANGQSLGIEFTHNHADLINQATGSTDMGNVSHVVPSIHPMFYIGTKAANHSRDYTAAAGADEAQMYTLRQAKALAMTALDVFFNPEFIPKMNEELKADLHREQTCA